MEILDQLALALGFATLAGLNLYLTVLVTGMAIQFQWIELLPRFESLAVLGEPPVILAAGALFLLEFFADKIPWVDSLWDFFHTLVRPVGGSLLALQSFGDTAAGFDVVIALLAGSATMLTHGLKAGTRLAINASPEPVSNIATSIVEDAAVVGASLLMWLSPKIALIVFAAFLAFAIYATPRIYRSTCANMRLLLAKLRAPALGRSRTPRHLPSRVTSGEEIVLSAELGGKPPAVEWALPVLLARSRGVRGLVPNLLGKIVAEESRPGTIFFVGRKNWRPILREIPLEDCHFHHEPRFLSEDLAIYNKHTRMKLVLRFCRPEADLVDQLAERLEERAAAARKDEEPAAAGEGGEAEAETAAAAPDSGPV